MNPFDPSRQPQSRPEQTPGIATPHTATRVSQILQECRSYVEQVSSICHSINEQSARLSRVQDRYDRTLSALEDTERAHHKEYTRIERCEKYKRLCDNIERSLQPRLVQSIDELVVCAGRIAGCIPELRTSYHALAGTRDGGQVSLAQLRALSSGLYTFSAIASQYLQRIPNVNQHAHLLRRFDGDALESVAHDLAFFDAELTRVRVALEKIFAIGERAQSALERVDEYRGFAQEFADEVKRLHGSVAVIDQERQLLIEDRKERIHEVQGVLTAASRLCEEMARDVTLATPTQRDFIMQALAAIQQSCDISEGKTAEPFATRAQAAMTLLHSAIEQCEKAWCAASADELAGVPLPQVPLGGQAAELEREAVTVRFGSPRDMAAVIRIERKCFETPWQEEDFTEFLNKDGRFLWCAVAGDEVIGFVFGIDHERSIEIISVAVDPKHQRQRVGSRLIAKAISDLADSNKDSISLVVRERNTDAQLFFKRSGFQFTRGIEGYFTDSQETAYQMVYQRYE